MATKAEFAPVMAYLSAAFDKPVSVETAKVYFDLLGDLDTGVLVAAARLACLEHRFATLPPPGAIRRHAVELIHGKPPTGLEAWGMVRRAIARFGLRREAEALASLPDAVRAAVAHLGWDWLCDCIIEGVAQTRFVSVYESESGKVDRLRMAPPGLAERLAGIGDMPRKPPGRLTDGRTPPKAADGAA